MTDKQALRNLRSCELFSTLGNSELEKIAALALEKEYEAGTTIFQEGDSADELLVLLEGKVALQMTLSKAQRGMKRRITVDLASANEVIGWSALVEPFVYTLTAVCLQRARALSISSDKIRWLLQNDHEIGYEVLNGLVRVIASRLHDTRQILISERSLP